MIKIVKAIKQKHLGRGGNRLRPPLYPERGSATENNMLSISVNLICTDRQVHIAPIGVQPDMTGNNLSGVAVQFATQFWANATQ